MTIIWKKGADLFLSRVVRVLIAKATVVVMIIGANARAEGVTELSADPALFAFAAEPTPATASCAFHRSMDTSLMFTRVQVVRVNEFWGPLFERKLRFKEWISVSDNAVLGLDEHGELFNVLKIAQGRALARPLASHHTFEHIFLSSEGALLALNSKGELFRYAHAKWSQSPWVKILVRTGAYFAGLSAVCFAGMAGMDQIVNHFTGAVGRDLAATDLMGMSATMASMTSFFFGLHQFEKANNFPDGFVKVADLGADAKVRNDDVNRQLQLDGTVRDVELEIEGEAASLKQKLEAVPLADSHHFDVRCEDKLMPYGVSESAWVAGEWR